MTDRIKKYAYDVLHGDSFPASVPELCPDPKELEDPVAIGEGLRRYLAKQPITFRDDELFTDRYRWFACEYPGDYYCCTGHKYRNEYWDQHSYHAATNNDIYYWGWTHMSLDYEYVLKNGLKGYYDRIEASLAAHAGEEENIRTLQGMKLCLDAIIDRNNLVAAEAEKMADKAADDWDKSRFLTMARTLRKVPLNPADTFFEAVQSVWTMFLVSPDSLGRIDQFMYPYYIREKNAGTLTYELAQEYLEELFVKVHSFQGHNDEMPISGHNHMVVGGYTQDGEDGYNELSRLIVYSVAELPTIRPQVSFRYTDKTTRETIREITELNYRCQIIVFVNDEPRIKGMVNAGLDLKDAIEYTVVGCNEWAVAGTGKLDLAHANLYHPLKELIWNQRDRALACKTYDEFYALFKANLENDMRFIVDEYSIYYTECAGDISLISSVFCEGCIEKPGIITRKGSKYHGLSISFSGVSNVADSLSVIKDFVFERKQLTLEQLFNVLDNNWEGEELLRKKLLREGHFFGNADSYVDSIANQVVVDVEDIRKTLKSDCANIIVCGSFTGATHPNLVYGRALKATPDGRRAGEGLTMGISQTEGKDHCGMGAYLTSIAAIEYDKFCGCIVSNILIDPKNADTSEKRDKIAALFYTYLKMGGMQLQINYRNAEVLIDAQKHPENYSELMVRVTGYSGYFVNFAEDLQNDIIIRTSQCAG